MARLYTDENFPVEVAAELRLLGHDVLTIQESGKAGIGLSDPEVLAYACNDQRAVLTFNRRHFIILHNRQPAHFGIIVCTDQLDAVALAQRIDQAIVSHTALDGQLIRINKLP